MKLPRPKRIAIIPADLSPLPLAALEYLVLKLNTLQNEVQYEFLPITHDHPYLAALRPGAVIPMDDFRGSAPGFFQNVQAYLLDASIGYGLRPQTPDRYVLISLAALDSNYYEIWEDDYSAVFLGRWEDRMAPPSLLEFILTMVMVEGLACIIRMNVNHISHLATRGCIADFNPMLRDLRNKTLQGFLCHDCRTVLESKIGPKHTANWIRILDKEWIGDLAHTSSPASIVEKLGYDLFITRGLKLTRSQRFLKLLREDGVKELIKLVGGVLLVAILAWLGLKK